MTFANGVICLALSHRFWLSGAWIASRSRSILQHSICHCGIALLLSVRMCFFLTPIGSLLKLIFPWTRTQYAPRQPLYCGYGLSVIALRHVVWTPLIKLGSSPTVEWVIRQCLKETCQMLRCSFIFKPLILHPHPCRGVPLVLKLLYRFQLMACKSHSMGSSVYHSRLENLSSEVHMEFMLRRYLTPLDLRLSAIVRYCTWSSSIVKFLD